MKRYRSLILIVVVSIIFTSCVPRTATMEKTNGGSPTSLFKSLPTPLPGKAVLYGQIDNSNNIQNKYIIFLSRNLTEGEDSIPATLAFSYNNDPRAQQNDSGEFVFTDVEPGQYAIVFWSIEEIKVVESDSSPDLFKLINVSEGDVIDLGLLPIP